MKKALLIITSDYPYSTGESFIETEEKFWDFDLVILVPFRKNGNMRKYINPNIRLIKPPINKRNFGFLLDYLISLFSLFFKGYMRKEVFFILKSKKNRKKKLTELLKFYKYSMTLTKNVKKDLNKYTEYDFTVYSYWLHLHALIALMLKKRYGYNCFSRCHGVDLYLERHETQYLPLRDYLIENMDGVFPCSQNGTDYLLKAYPQYKNKIKTSYLGTVDLGERQIKKSKTFTIVTCSNIVKVKRLDKLIEVLAALNFKNIKWVHFGSGELQSEVEKQAEELLHNSIEYEFKGQVSNSHVMDYYKNNDVDLFINVSSSEGLPVSIMEAISFGIPVIATDVGGTGEIVNYNTGLLLSENFTVEQGVAKITEIYDMYFSDYESYLDLRKTTRKFWCDNFNSEENYKKFVDNLKKY